MSANRFSVACCCVVFGVLPLGLALSRPHDHWTVPAPNTSAPLGIRWRVRLCVAVPFGFVHVP